MLSQILAGNRPLGELFDHFIAPRRSLERAAITSAVDTGYHTAERLLRLTFRVDWQPFCADVALVSSLIVQLPDPIWKVRCVVSTRHPVVRVWVIRVSTVGHVPDRQDGATGFT